MLSQYNLVIDAHFCIYIDNKILPGFHQENLRRIISANPHSGLVHLIAHPNTISQRRKDSQKAYKNYPTIGELSEIERELADSKIYFKNFATFFSENNIAVIDSSVNSLEQVIAAVRRVYDSL
jgi:adenylate kinase